MAFFEGRVGGVHKVPIPASAHARDRNQVRTVVSEPTGAGLVDGGVDQGPWLHMHATQPSENRGE